MFSLCFSIHQMPETAGQETTKREEPGKRKATGRPTDIPLMSDSRNAGITTGHPQDRGPNGAGIPAAENGRPTATRIGRPQEGVKTQNGKGRQREASSSEVRSSLFQITASPGILKNASLRNLLPGIIEMTSTEMTSTETTTAMTFHPCQTDI